MEILNNYARTDLACEACARTGSISGIGIDYREYTEDGIEIGVLTVENGEGEKTSGRRAGKYYNIVCGKIWLWSDAKMELISSVIASHISKSVLSLTNKSISPDFRVLVVGLGNSAITADAVGPFTVDNMTVTRHIKSSNRLIYDSIGCCEIAAIKPGVLGQTGIESSELIKGTVNFVRPDVIVAVDALAARSCDRIASTVQLSDNGIHPGSGIGNRRSAITRESTGVPVIALGVPTVVDSSTLVYDALEKAGITEKEISPDLAQVLENGKSFFVSLKESDIILTEISTLLSKSIERAFKTGNEGAQGDFCEKKFLLTP